MNEKLDYAALDPAELGVLMEHASARLRGQTAPPPNPDGNVPATPSWAALSDGERGRLVDAMIAELQGSGLANCFIRHQAVALHERAARPVLAVGNRGELVNRSIVDEVKAELAKPANRNIVASVNERTGAVRVFMAPASPWSVNAEALIRMGTRVAELKAALARLDGRGALWIERARVEADLRTAERKLKSAEVTRQRGVSAAAST